VIEALSEVLKVTTVEPEELSEDSVIWSDLSSHGLMQTPIWLMNAWSHFHRFQPGVAERDFLGLMVSDSDGTAAGCSLWFQQLSHAARWWRLVGSGAICSDYAQIPCRPELEEQVGIATAEWFHSQPRSRLGFPTVIEVEGHLADNRQWHVFFEALGARGWSLDSVEIEGCWQLSLPGDWYSYEMQLNKSQRRKARRAMKLLQEGTVEHVVCRTVPEIEDYWPSFVELHQKRRQWLGQPGCFADSCFERFLKSTTRSLATKQAAWLSIVLSQQKAIAALLIFERQGTSYLYQSGIDTDRLEMEPGHIVNAATINTCIKAGQTHFDFLRGDERYKSSWRATRSGLMRTRLFSPGLAGRQLASAQKLRRNLMSWVRPRNSGSHSTMELSPDES